jgi:hypothetical protein
MYAFNARICSIWALHLVVLATILCVDYLFSAYYCVKPHINVSSLEFGFYIWLCPIVYYVEVDYPISIIY